MQKEDIATIDEYWMSKALLQAKQAAERDEVPVGAVLVSEANELIAEAYNQPIGSVDPSAHAEINALRIVAQKLDNYRLPNTTLYVTLEPCTMCVGALVHARVKRIVYGAAEPKAGAITSAHQLLESGAYNHIPEVTPGVKKDDCSSLLSVFFENKRLQKKKRSAT